ncbi:MAG: Flp pilus assembly complex ATPase component TadA [Nitrososphaerota archaeon]|jgi:flagellar protein FlaI|nr:Flp pilus assembly complex ATPase component TadA [Nitrososphaerota archaeon]MDG6935827.1 Flp pilus assembly complex ATPase component TadA [Nitrososphaerota archaeon]MDG6944594.1 Flp pilus assembly complex ATPase component TadA [Nitrososphaerota archaeon]
MKLPKVNVPLLQKKQQREAKFAVRTVPAVVIGEIVKEYDIGQAHIIITKAGDRHYYFVREPELTDAEKAIYSELMEAVYYSFRSSDDKDQMSALENFIWKASEDLEIMEQVKASYSRLDYYILRDALGFGIIDALMKDDDVEEVSCEGYDKNVAVIHREFPGFDWLDTNVKFESEDELGRFVQKIVMRSGKAISTAIPYVDATLPDGSRLASTFGSEISMPGSSFDVRKFPRDPFTAPRLISFGTLSPLLAAYYWLILEAKGFSFITGSTGSGKSTALNVLLQLINPNLKIATIEETLELNIPHEHWERLRTRYTFGGSASDIDIFDLTKLTLRMRPDYVIVGEARGSEIQFLFQASASVTHDTPVLIREKGQVRLAKIGEVVDRHYTGNGEGPVYVNKLEALTLKDGKVGFAPVSYVLRHRAGEIYRIGYVGGHVRATGSHSAFVLDEGTGEIAEKAVDQLKQGDILVSFSTFSRGKKQVLDLSGCMSGNNLTLTRESIIPDRGNPIPRRVDLNDIAVFLGEYLADGSVDLKNGKYHAVNISHGLKKLPKYVPVLSKMAASMGMHIYEYDEGTCMEFRLNNARFAEFMSNFIGRIGREKRVPPEVWVAGSKTIRKFLDGYEADGCRVEKGIRYSTASQSLAYEIGWLSRLAGYLSCVTSQAQKPSGRTYYTMGVSTQRKNRMLGALVPSLLIRNIYERLRPKFSRAERSSVFHCSFLNRKRRFVKKETAQKLLELFIANARNAIDRETERLIANARMLIEGDAVLTTVKEIAREKYEGYVYDLSVPGSEAFFGGTTPVLLHNSGHGALSTFHGDSVESAIARMTTEPLNVGRAQLMLVWSFLQVNRVRLESGNVVRRAVTSREVDPMNGSLVEIFRWDPKNDKIMPEEPAKVVDSSVRLKSLENVWGWDRERLAMELEERAEFLKKLAMARKLAINEISPEIKKFYERKYYSR